MINTSENPRIPDFIYYIEKVTKKLRFLPLYNDGTFLSAQIPDNSYIIVAMYVNFQKVTHQDLHPIETFICSSPFFDTKLINENDFQNEIHDLYLALSEVQPVNSVGEVSPHSSIYGKLFTLPYYSSAIVPNVRIVWNSINNEFLIQEFLGGWFNASANVTYKQTYNAGDYVLIGNFMIKITGGLTDLAEMDVNLYPDNALYLDTRTNMFYISQAYFNNFDLLTTEASPNLLTFERNIKIQISTLSFK